MLGYAPDADHIVVTLSAEFDICLEKGLKLNPRKCNLVATNDQFWVRPHLFQGCRVAPPPVRGSAVNAASEYCLCAYGDRSCR